MAKKSTSTTKKKSTPAAKSNQQKVVYKKAEEKPARELSPMANAIIPYVISFVAILIVFSFLAADMMGFVGGGIRSALFGLFSLGGWFIPLYLVMTAIFWQRDNIEKTRRFRIITSVIAILLISILRYIATKESALFNVKDFSLAEFYAAGKELVGGGAVGGMFGWLFSKAFGNIGSILICSALLLLLTTFMVGFTPRAIFVMIKDAIADGVDKRRQKADEIAAKSSQKQHYAPAKPEKIDKPKHESTDNIPQNTAVQTTEKVLPSPEAFDEPEAVESVKEDKHRRKKKHDLFKSDLSIDSTVGENSVDAEVESIPLKERNVEMNLRKPVLYTSKREESKEEVKQEPKKAESVPADTAEIERKNAMVDPFPEGELYSEADEAVEIYNTEAETSKRKIEEDFPFDDTDENENAVQSNTEARAFISQSELEIDENVSTERTISDDTDDILDKTAFDEIKNNYPVSDDSDNNPLSAEIIKRVQDSMSEDKDKSAADTEEEQFLGDSEIDEKFDEVMPVVEYKFPPITLLNQAPPPSNDDISEELQETAKTIVSTLESFKIGTRIVNVSRGPTITRYELVPAEGVRVRSIINSIDDIALNLATSGVRIEAPIPGKQAIGIEVPNRNVSTVWLRELIDTQKFRDASSKLNLCLGADVAGDPVYIDIAKMPHLLISGATGMGKSVCINSLIVSLLYKASPDDVKLILIDPKKVELNIYNGLPHLLVPVVSDPKKAAGSLSWAVGEMERRFTMIEEVGMRNIEGYNNIAKDDPNREVLPKIVIIIDELADLMMMARDSVEESICRIAQKARAAGMHLIIGTQRPSVDVITGLIKANVPSRIAFRMASQVDSRTVIDITGAEKLIGRGDMLYAPVGSTKPTRVQGSYVGENEIDKIIDFIKEQTGDAEYDSEVIDGIEREAAKCNTGKKGSGSNSEFSLDDIGDTGDEEETDPMFKPAVELALEYGKISVSLLQTRLKLGHGRAARLVYHMQQRGIISEPDGQKPRTTLITRAQYNEMLLNNDMKFE